MIISDLSHCEVVAETNSILGGSDTLPSFQIASSTLNGISSQLSSPLNINKLVTQGNEDASVTVGSFTTKLAGEPVKGVISVTSAISK